MARQLLRAPSPLLRTVGALLLNQMRGLDEDTLRLLASDENLSVPLNVLGWLQDAGQFDGVENLQAMLGDATRDPEALREALDTDVLLEGGKRAVLSMMQPLLSPAEAGDLCRGYADDSRQPYSVRMKCAYLLRGTTDFEQYRENVAEMLAATEDRQWTKGLKRLAEQLEGPAAFHSGPPQLTVDDVDERLARPYPTMIEDLALYIEYVLSADGHTVDKGAAENLEEYLAEFNKKPWTPEQEASLRRLQSLTRRVAAEENAQK